MSVNAEQSKLTIKQAAAMMGVTMQFLRMGLRQQRFPFGIAVKMKRWAYYINPEQFIEYIGKEKQERDTTS